MTDRWPDRPRGSTAPPLRGLRGRSAAVLTGPATPMQPTLMSAALRAATITPGELTPAISVITITGIGDHLRPEWPITITGMRTRPAPDRPSHSRRSGLSWLLP